MTTKTTFPRDLLDPMRTTGLILCGMGGPDGPEAVEPFLRNLFQDPAIFPLPRLVAGFVGRMIARRRAPKVRARYALISDESTTPQLKTTREQAEILARQLGDSGRTTDSSVAMRYWHPFPEQSVARLLDRGVDQFLLVPAYPQYSGATSGSTFSFVLDAVRRLAPDAKVYVLADWHLLPGYVEALAEPIIEHLSRWAGEGIDAAESVLLYVAHSLPESFIRKGDPYLDQTRATIAAVHERVTRAIEAAYPCWLDGITGGSEPCLVFQSKVGPIRWLGPQIDEEVPRLAAAGCRRLMVQPVSFTCEHIETLLELDVELKDQAFHEGIVEFRRGSALNLNKTWLVSLADHLADVAFPAKAG